MNQNMIRMWMLAISIAMSVLFILSAAMAPYRDPAATMGAMAVCAAYALFRAANGEARRGAMADYRQYHKTGLERMPHIRRRTLAGLAWAFLDASWIAVDATVCLTWGIPGVLAILFQGLFLAGFDTASKIRPDLYDTDEKAQAMDMLEALLAAQACAFILVWAWFHRA